MDQHTRMLTPKIQNESGNNDFSEGQMPSVKKTKKRRLRIISDYDEASRQEKSPSNLEFSPVTRERSTISGQEKSTYKTTRITPIFIKSLRPEKSPSKPEESAVPKRSPRMPKAASNQEKSPTEPGHSPVSRGRSTTSIEASSKPQHSRVTRERSRFSVYYLRPLNSSSVPEESSVKRKRPRESVEHFEPEECPSEPEQSPFKKRKTVIPTSITSIEVPSKPEHARVTRERSRFSVYYLRPLNSSLIPEESSVKRKRPRETVQHFEPEECPSEPEQSPIKKGRTGTGDQLNHSGQKNLSAKAKASKIKSAAPVDNNEVLSDLGENSVPIVKRKINRMALSGKIIDVHASPRNAPLVIHMTRNQSNRQF
ncbi:hypothetical protein TNCV_3482361 [Trichonephila clavipes]|nr:hypothetical protein TNCV_3482361 [Trichonephila clavipes]